MALSSERPYFDKIPWCSALLNVPGTTVFAPASRGVKHDPSNTHADQFFGRTLNTERTIPHSVSFYRYPSPGSEVECATIGNTGCSSNSSNEQGFYVPECMNLHVLAAGVNGFEHVAHGGLVAALLDEAMGVLIELNQALLNSAVETWSGRRDDGMPALRESRVQKQHISLPGDGEEGNKKEKKTEKIRWHGMFASMDLFTAGMNIKYRRPVTTPRVVLTRAVVMEIEGRKMRMKAQVLGERGDTLAECDSVWVGVRRDHL